MKDWSGEALRGARGQGDLASTVVGCEGREDWRDQETRRQGRNVGGGRKDRWV